MWSGLNIEEFDLAMAWKTAKPGLNRRGVVKKALRNRLLSICVVGSLANGDLEVVRLLVVGEMRVLSCEGTALSEADAGDVL